jgi:hypothetical protein
LNLRPREKQPELSLELDISFSLHTFTHQTMADDDPTDDYSDNRECRTFDHERYQLSFRLPEITRGLRQRRCEFARTQTGTINFVTIDLNQGDRYGVFFDLRRWLERGENVVQLVVESAYKLDPAKPHPGHGRIKLNTLLGHTMRGTNPSSRIRPRF